MFSYDLTKFQNVLQSITAHFYWEPLIGHDIYARTKDAMTLIINLISNFNEEIAFRLKEEGLTEFHIGIKWLACWFSQKNDFPNT